MSTLIESDTPFQVITVDGKPHIGTPLTLLSHGVHENVAYLGSKDRYVRGIPVRQWLACTRLHKTKKSVKIIISYSSYFNSILSIIILILKCRIDKTPVFIRPGKVVASYSNAWL